MLHWINKSNAPRFWQVGAEHRNHAEARVPLDQEKCFQSCGVGTIRIYDASLSFRPVVVPARPIRQIPSNSSELGSGTTSPTLGDCRCEVGPHKRNICSSQFGQPLRSAVSVAVAILLVPVPIVAPLLIDPLRMVSIKLGVAAFAGLKTSKRPVRKVQVPGAAVLQPEDKVMPVSLNLWADPTRLTKKEPAFKPSEAFTLPIEPLTKLPVSSGNGGRLFANADVAKTALSKNL